MIITIPLAPVTKKNSQRVVGDTIHKRIIQSKEYLQYQHDVGIYLKQCSRPLIDYPVNIEARFYMPTMRRVDISNLISALDDVLVLYGVLFDDNRDIVAGHDGSRVLYDKAAPRTDIVIKPMEDYQKWHITMTK